MARRTKRDPGSGRDRTLPTTYEGPTVLAELLGEAGSPFDVDEVVERFRQAQQAGEERSDVIPTLFPDEPRFPTHDDARRLYSNLFGLWNRLAAGLSVADETPEDAAASAVEEPPASPAPPLPPRGIAAGTVLQPELVEAVWKHLDALPEREQRRLRHRFEAAQPDLVAWLDAAPLSDAAAIAAHDLVFETWAMFDVAFGDRVKAVPFPELRAMGDEPPPLTAEQPALAAYAAEVLDLLAEEDEGFGAASRAQVERVLGAAAAGLVGALEED